MDKTKIAVDVFNKLANLYQEKFMDVNLYGDTFDFFAMQLKKKTPKYWKSPAVPGTLQNTY